MSCHTYATLTALLVRTATGITPAQLARFATAASALGDDLSLWNRFAIWAQRPAARHVEDRQTWELAYEARVAPGAEPLAIAQGDQVVHVYDRADVVSTLACPDCNAAAGQRCRPRCPSGAVPAAVHVPEEDIVALVLKLARAESAPMWL